ncbi:MAG: hypothetical protein KDA33_16600 [Phycisphaerales bacterium]|nr:hypothetical protein [Phycisphaerales bacterium]
MLKYVLLFLLLAALFAAPAFGQIEVGDIPPDNIDLLDYKRAIWENVTGGMFLVMALAIGFKASKRAHGA